MELISYLFYELMTETQRKIIELLQSNGPMSRSEICEAFGFKKYTYRNISYQSKKAIESHRGYHAEYQFHRKRTTIYDNLLKLQKRKVVEKFTKNNGKRGRPIVYWRLSN